MPFWKLARWSTFIFCGVSCVSFLGAEETTAQYDESSEKIKTTIESQAEENLIEQIGAECCAPSDCCSVTSECGCGAGGCGSAGCGCGCGGSDYLSFLHSDKKLLADWRNVPLHDCWTASVGGQLRYRFIDEDNRLRPQGPGRTSYDQWRFTPFVDLQYSDWFTAHVEAIDASTFNEDLPTLGIDVNRSDLVQVYADIKLAEHCDSTLNLRYGRQFLKYGSQHLISPLAWSNTYRPFDGFKLYYQSSLWDVDGIAAQSINFPGGHKYQPTSFDNPDENRWLYGIYSTYKGLESGPVDFYWLWLRDDEPATNRLDGNRHTIGARSEGKSPVKNCCGKVTRTYIWDIEGAWQFGEDDFGTATDADVNAGFVSLMAGHVWNQVTWSPTLKGVFYWASGDDDPNDNEVNTFTPLYPLGHAYWGIIDNLNGSNLLDYSVQASVKPSKKLTFITAMHWFEKDEGADFIYNVAGAPVGPNNTDREIGSELDFIGTYQVNKNLQVQCGYSVFWYGDAVTETALVRDDATQFYTMVTWGF